MTKSAFSVAKVDAQIMLLADRLIQNNQYNALEGERSIYSDQKLYFGPDEYGVLEKTVTILIPKPNADDQKALAAFKETFKELYDLSKSIYQNTQLMQLIAGKTDADQYKILKEKSDDSNWNELTGLKEIGTIPNPTTDENKSLFYAVKIMLNEKFLSKYQDDLTIFNSNIAQLTNMKVNLQRRATKEEFDDLVKEAFAAVKLPKYCAIENNFKPNCIPQKITINKVVRVYATRRNGFGKCEQTCFNPVNNTRWQRCRINLFSFNSNYCSVKELEQDYDKTCDNYKSSNTKHGKIGYYYSGKSDATIADFKTSKDQEEKKNLLKPCTDGFKLETYYVTQSKCVPEAKGVRAYTCPDMGYVQCAGDLRGYWSKTCMMTLEECSTKYREQGMAVFSGAVKLVTFILCPIASPIVALLQLAQSVISLANTIYDTVKWMVTQVKDLALANNERISVTINAATDILVNRIQDAELKDEEIAQKTRQQLLQAVKTHATAMKKKANDKETEAAAKGVLSYFETFKVNMAAWYKKSWLEKAGTINGNINNMLSVDKILNTDLSKVKTTTYEAKATAFTKTGSAPLIEFLSKHCGGRALTDKEKEILAFFPIGQILSGLTIAQTMYETINAANDNPLAQEQKVTEITKKVIGFASYFDPTGILGMISPFIRDTCPIQYAFPKVYP